MVEPTDAPIHLVAYDPAWPARFEAERVRLAEAIGDWIEGGIEHVGSTAVPGLTAKPVIDIMIGVRNLDDSRPALPHLEAIGYQYVPYRATEMHWLCKPSRAFRTHHLHLVPYGGRLWAERLAFRDHLRAHPKAAHAYAELKRQLAEKHPLDRDAYTDEKGPFVDEVLALALGGRTDPPPPPR